MPPARIEHIDLIHFCHTDHGFTDHPTICREFHRRYLDIAVDAVLAKRAFIAVPVHAGQRTS
jgi:hypothetical protein